MILSIVVRVIAWPLARRPARFVKRRRCGIRAASRFGGVLVLEARDVPEHHRRATAMEPSAERYGRDAQPTRSLAQVRRRLERHKTQHDALDLRERRDASQDGIRGDAREAHPADAQRSRRLFQALAGEAVEVCRTAAKRGDLERRAEQVPDAIAVGQADEHLRRRTRASQGFRQRVEVRGQAAGADADRAAGGRHQRVEAAPAVGQRPHGAGAVAATRIADDEGPVESQEPTV